MKTTDLINALVFALEDKDRVKWLDAALSRENCCLTGHRIEALLDLYKRGALNGQQHNVYTNMMQVSDPYTKVAETAIVENAGYIAEIYGEGMPLAILQAVTGAVEDDLKEHVAEYERERWG